MIILILALLGISFWAGYQKDYAEATFFMSIVITMYAISMHSQLARIQRHAEEVAKQQRNV